MPRLWYVGGVIYLFFCGVGWGLCQCFGVFFRVGGGYVLTSVEVWGFSGGGGGWGWRVTSDFYTF